MKCSEQIVRSFGAFGAALVAVFFAMAYHGAKYHTHVEHEHLELPNATRLFSAVVPWALLVPLVVLVLGLLLRRRPLALTVIACAGWLFALGWALMCILVWELPFVLL